MESFKNKNIVITGGASGVGRALAMRLGREGAHLLVTDIQNDSLDKTVQDLKAEGIEAEGKQLDVTKRDDVFTIADYAFEKFSPLDCVFNNAGVGAGGGAFNWEVPEEAFHWGMAVNFYGPLYGIQAFVPRMLEQDKEAIIAVTSSGAGVVFPQMAPAYCASKSAVIALYETLSHQLQLMGSKLRAAILFPGPHIVNTQLMNSQRNLLPEFDIPALREGSGITDLNSLQQVMKETIGHEVDITEAEEFADYTHDALLEGKFWVKPLTQMGKAAIRKRFEEMITETGPSIPTMF